MFIIIYNCIAFFARDIHINIWLLIFSGKLIRILSFLTILNLSQRRSKPKSRYCSQWVTVWNRHWLSLGSLSESRTRGRNSVKKSANNIPFTHFFSHFKWSGIQDSLRYLRSPCYRVRAHSGETMVSIKSLMLTYI